MDVSTTLDSLLSGVRNLHAELTEKEEALRAELDETVTERKKLDRVIAATLPPRPHRKVEDPLAPVDPEPEPEPQKRYLTEETKAKVLQAIHACTYTQAIPGQPGTFTRKQLEEQMKEMGLGGSAFTVHNSIEVLCDAGVVRKAGLAPKTTPTGQQAQAFALVTGDGYED